MELSDKTALTELSDFLPLTVVSNGADVVLSIQVSLVLMVYKSFLGYSTYETHYGVLLA